MKKIISWGMMLAAAFTLTNCAKEIEDPNQQPEKQGYPFEIVASTVDTKTVNNGMATKWDDNDAINLFHAVAGAQDYGTNDEFTIANVETGRFTGMLTEALEAGKSYDWYALYPYNSNIATPGDRADGYTYIGHSKGLNQTGYDNMASLKETICPLYGVAKAVASSDTPSITMNHLTSVVAIKVTNTTEEPLTITTASLTAEEDIVGSYFIDITKSPVVYKASEGFVENTAVVNVSDGTALAKGESATLYLAIKPFTAKAGTSLTLSVNDYAKEPKVLTSDVTFHAGKIKTLNFAYDKVAPKTVTWDLSKNETSDATTDKIAWTSNFAEMYCDKASASTNANNYYGGDDNNRTSTRFYKSSILTIIPKTGYKITSVVFTATSVNYATALSGSSWTNASAEVNSSTVTVTPTNGTQPMTATIGGTCGFTSVVVYYTENEGGETPAPETLESIAVENPKTDYTVGEAFVPPAVKATYSRGTVKDVTGATFTGYDMTTADEQTVTVSFTEGEVTVTTSYNITVSEPVVDDSDYSGQYAIVAYRNSESLYYYLTNEETSTSTVRLTAVSAGTNKPEDNVVVDASKLWNVSKSGSVYTIQSVASEEYVSWTSGNSAEMSETGLQFTVTKQDDGSFNFVSGDRYLSLNGTQGNDYFAMYTGTQAQNLYLIKAVEGEEAPATLESIAVSGEKTTYTVGEEFVKPTVKATYSDGSKEDVTASATFDGYNMSVAGTYTVTVSYEDKTTEYKITVSDVVETDKTWTLVTDVNNLAVGDEIIIAAKDYDYALSTTQNTNNRGQTSVSKSDNTLDAPGADVQILTLMQGSTSGTFAFYTGSNYLYAASSSNNYLKQQSTLNANASWKITIADGIATIVAQGSNTRNTMQYNQSNGLFACYGSASQKALAIYKQMPSSGDVGGTTPDPEEPENPDTPETGEPTTITMTTFSATEASMDDNVSYTTAKGGGTSAPAVNSNQIRLYQNSAGTGGGTITITAKDGYKLSSVTIGSSMGTSVSYTIESSTTKSTNANVSANGKYTVDDINATSITFYCMGTSSSSRLYVNYLSATYVAD